MKHRDGHGGSNGPPDGEVSRRQFIGGTSAAVIGAGASTLGIETARTAALAQQDEVVAAPRTRIRLTVNGQEREAEVEDRWTLNELLRDELELTGSKIGCNRGECGACTVLLDGEPVYSCSTLAVWVDGRDVQTVEGLEENGQLSSLQEAFVTHNGAQCGFCTPGQLMTASALLARNPNPTADEVRDALAGNLCRCSNYNAIVEAVTGRPGEDPMSAQDRVAPLNTVGRDVPRIDALERVTGRAEYTRDLRLPGMLYARVLRSPHPHARIVRFDASRAEALPGVRAVISHDTYQWIYSSGSIAGGRQYSDAAKDITTHVRHMFDNPVRFVGQPVAAVAAVDRHTAEEALHRIDIEYEELPFELDPEEALQPGATPIWPEGNLALDAENQPRPSRLENGDPDAGFEAASQIFEDRYTTAFVQDAQMEPRSAMAQWEGDKVTIYTPTQGISNCRHDNARDLGLDDHQVRIICKYMGGGFGDKNGSYYFDLIAAALAKETEAPVMVELSRKDDWLGTHGRWHTVQDYRVGLDDNGTVTAIELTGYSGMGPYLRRSGGISGIDAYACENVRRTIYPVHTNRMVSGNFRAPSDPQGYFGIQSMMDDIAYKIEMDPVEFALRNMRRPTDEVPFTTYALDECIERGRELFDWPGRWRREPGSDDGPIKKGAGFAFMMFRSGVGPSSAILRVDSNERYTLFVGVTDIGPGAKTTLALIAAEELGVPLAQVDVVWGDTDRCPYSVGESGSRTTTMTGYAVVQAAVDLKNQIATSGMPEDDAVLIASATPTPSTEGRRRMCAGAHFVEVEADVQLGHVKVTKYVAVHESGRILNPLPARDQIRGAALQGVGQALHEDLLYDTRNGQPLTAGYYGARHVTHVDVPEIEVTFIETDDGYGPYGAKTVGESGIILGPAAVANAVFNAIGVRMKSLPITRQKILEALS